MTRQQEALRILIEYATSYHQRGWTPATSSNFSVRDTSGQIYITQSGKHKGRLTTNDFMRVDRTGEALDPHKPSAETAIHTLIYNTFPDTQCVLHTHSVSANALSMNRPDDTAFAFSGYEILKAFPGTKTHDTTLYLPVFDNTQDMAALAAAVSENILAFTLPGFLIRGHGVYAWGIDLKSADRHLEAIEFLLECDITRRTFER